MVNFFKVVSWGTLDHQVHPISAKVIGSAILACRMSHVLVVTPGNAVSLSVANFDSGER